MSEHKIYPVLVDTIDGTDTEAGTEVAFQASCSNPECDYVGDAQPTFDMACDDADEHTRTCLSTTRP